MTIPKAGDRRVQFDLLPERLVAFDQLMAYCDLRTRKDMFDNAMTLLEWAVEEVRNGRKIASYDQEKDHVEIVRFPILDNAARKAQAYKRIALVETAANETEADSGRIGASPRQPQLALATAE